MQPRLLWLRVTVGSSKNLNLFTRCVAHRRFFANLTAASRLNFYSGFRTSASGMIMFPYGKRLLDSMYIYECSRRAQ